MTIADKIEAFAQKLYDVRDSLPAEDERTWKKLDDLGKRLSKFAACVPRPRDPRSRKKTPAN